MFLPLSLLLGMAVVPRGDAAPLLAVTAQAAWHGMVKPGAETELAVTLLAEQNGAADVILPDHEPRLRVGVSLQAHQPHTLWLSVRPAADRPLRIEAQMPGAETAGTEIGFAAAPQDAVWVATTLDLPRDPAPGAAPFRVGPRMWPRTTGAYGGIDAVVLDRAGLAALDARQLAALRDYAAGCGRIVVAAPTLPDELSAAGCGGRFVAAAPDGEAALDAVRAAPARGAGALPASQRLETMAEGGGFTAGRTAVLLFFALYAMALVTYARHAHRRVFLLLLPVAAAALSWIAWSNDQAMRRLISWSEIDANTRTLRYAALLQITGAGKGESDTQIPAALGLPQPVAAHPDAELQLHESAAPGARLKLRNHLFARQSFYFQGEMPLQPELSLAMTNRGPAVDNRGSRASPPALLGWNDRRSPVPALQPGERWYPPEHGTPWNIARVEEQLLRSRTQSGAAAVLLPHTLLQGAGADPRIEERGWLLIVSG